MATWEWDQGDSLWTKFETIYNDQIESAFQKKHTTTNIYINNTKYIINFTDMLQKNSSTQGTRTIRRNVGEEEEKKVVTSEIFEQKKKEYSKTVSKDYGALLNSSTDSDIQFLVGDVIKKEKQKKFYGHKLIIGARRYFLF
jgi:vesicle coat complex subunit